MTDIEKDLNDINRALTVWQWKMMGGHAALVILLLVLAILT